MLDKEEVEPEYVKCLRTIVQTQDDREAKYMQERLDEMENCESGSKSSMYDFTRNYDKNLRSILTMTPIRNVQYMPYVFEWFSKFPFPSNSRNPISDDIAHFLTNSAQDFQHESALVEIIQVLRDNQKKFLPTHNNHANLCKSIVEVLSWMDVHKNVENKTIDKIFDFLKMLCTSKSSSQENISLACFIKFCEIFLKDDRPEPPSFYLIIVLQIVPEQLWKQHMDVAVKKIINEFTNERKIIHMLNIMCQWTVEHPNYMDYLSMWLCLFVGGLDNNNRCRILAELAEDSLPVIFPKFLRLEQFYNINNHENIIFQLLIIIRSQQLYHMMITYFQSFVDKFLGSYNTSNSFPEDKIVEKCSVIVKILNVVSKRFKVHLGTSCPKCESLEKIYMMIQKETNPSVTSHIPEESEEMEVSYPSTSSGVGLIDTGKVGLVNLGNTCYMNSVLQALAMTRQFCREVLLYKTTNDLAEQAVLKNLQNLFALLKYSTRTSLAPTEILHVSRPSYFMPGQQQDSSEFLCHLLDVMYEQEKSALTQISNNDQTIIKTKVEDKEMVVVEEDSPSLNSPLNEDGKSGNMTRWTTEENLSEGEELAQTQNGLSDSHSDSTDSGIQSVGGEDSSSSSSASSPAGTGSPALSSLVHRVFGGELKVSYQCLQCDTESHNTDRFRDLQLCFFENLEPSETVTVQDLIKLNYFMPETLTGDNKYRCDKCAGLCDAQRSIKIVQAPSHLILTLKHFRYDSESRLRTKLSRKVIYNETIQLPVLDQNNETYQLYAAVVHSGYSLDYGHYITYACDAKNNWYLFNDSYVAQTTIEDFKRLEPPDTPYILFYKKCTGEEDEEDAPDFSMISQNLQEFIEQDRRKFADERRNRQILKSSQRRRSSKSYHHNSWDRDRNDDDDAAGGGGGRNPPTSGCRDAINIPNTTCLC
ncbi:ubiquitin carboxyl-terminal hydrolase 35 isoform X2 [Nasonia vitripennis]|uniref:USP domain-containing protein n=1 Tax=Nasonia vitripennis TaxID=7425 RepID=A0A7M7GGU8_NASVI|nr:ubiquitin carboxyl-terminal hydrolase 35 isoform X2 [Nasonia vitripennis]